MDRLRALLLLPFVLCSLQTIKAQVPATLQLDTPIERSLARGEVHEFTVNMEDKSFAQIVVEQRGIDVVITVSSAAGKLLREYDTPNGAEGQEVVSFVALTAGAYRIAVSALDSDDAKPGRYQIKLLELRNATDQELKSGKNREAAQEKGFALLAEMDGLISQIKSPLTKIDAQLQAADLLWDFDEKRAAKYLSAAVAGAKELFVAMDVNSDEYVRKYQYIVQLRYRVLQALAQHDADAALDFLRATTPRDPRSLNTREVITQETALELSIADQIVEKDPNRAAQIVRQNLKKAYTQYLLNSVSQIATKDKELATQLIHEIVSKLLDEPKLSEQPETAQVVATLLRSYRTPGETGIKAQTRNMHTLLAATLLTEEDCRQLIQKAFNEVVSYKSSRLYNPRNEGVWTLMAGLRGMGAELDKFVGGGTATLSKKQAEVGGGEQRFVDVVQDFQNILASGSPETVMQALEKAPPEYREQLYMQLANREAANGNFARAKQIVSDHVPNVYQRKEVLRNLEQQEIAASLSKGKIEEALRKIGNLSNPRERASQISQLANQFISKQKPAIALSLLDQALNMLGPSAQVQDYTQMQALLEIGRAFGNYDSKRSFEIIDPLIDQFNEICGAARTLEGFGTEFFEDDELNFQNGSTLAQLAQHFSTVLGSLALSDFDRAKSSADKIRLPEVRLRTYLDIATQTIEIEP